MKMLLVARPVDQIMFQCCLIVDVRDILIYTTELASYESGLSDPWSCPGRLYSAFSNKGLYVQTYCSFYQCARTYLYQ
jgi:hypothetical protein